MVFLSRLRICAILLLCSTVVATSIDKRSTCGEKCTGEVSFEIFAETENCTTESNEDEQEFALVYYIYQERETLVRFKKAGETRHTRTINVADPRCCCCQAGQDISEVKRAIRKSKKHPATATRTINAMLLFVMIAVGVIAIVMWALIIIHHRNDVNNSQISADMPSTESKNDDQELIVSDCNNAERETPLPIEKGEDSSETCADTEHNSTESKEDEEGLNIGDDSDCNNPERAVPLPIEKESTMNTHRLIIGNKGRDYIMKRYGVLNKASRYKMLLLCGKKAKAEGNRRFRGHLKRSAEMFTGTSWNIGKVDYKALCHLVVARIPEDDWMEFVRMDLNLEETEIQRFRGQYCIFNREQKRQILEGF